MGWGWLQEIAASVQGAPNQRAAEAALTQWQERADQQDRFADLVYESGAKAWMAGQLFVRDVELPDEVAVKLGRKVSLAAEAGPSGSFLSMTFEEALNLFLSREVLPESEAFDWLGRLRQGAFGARRLTSERVLESAKSALATIIEKGGDASTFAEAVRAQEVTLGIAPSGHGYLRTVFETNTVSAYSAGRDVQLTQPEVIEAIPYRQYVAVLDARTRPSHAALDGKQWDARQSDEWRRYQGPNGFNCFPAGVRVGGTVEAGLRGFYAGQLVELHTKSGRVLPVTPNHPILTSTGFEPAGQLRVGQHLVTHEPLVEGDAVGAVDEQDREPNIEDVWDALSVGGGRLSRRPGAHDLHGDGLRMRHEQIDVVWADGVLRDHGGEVLQVSEERALMLANARLPEEMRLRSLHSFRESDLAATGTDPSSPGLTLNSSSTPGLDSAPLDQFGLGPAAALDASLTQPAGHDRSTDAVFLRELQLAGAGAIALDEIVHIRTFDFCGHVYDLQSPRGWIAANGVIASNCRCMIVSRSEPSQTGLAMSATHPDAAFDQAPSVAV